MDSAVSASKDSNADDSMCDTPRKPKPDDPKRKTLSHETQTLPVWNDEKGDADCTSALRFIRVMREIFIVCEISLSLSYSVLVALAVSD